MYDGSISPYNANGTQLRHFINVCYGEISHKQEDLMRRGKMGTIQLPKALYKDSARFNRSRGVMIAVAIAIVILHLITALFLGFWLGGSSDPLIGLLGLCVGSLVTLRTVTPIGELVVIRVVRHDDGIRVYRERRRASRPWERRDNGFTLVVQQPGLFTARSIALLDRFQGIDDQRGPGAWYAVAVDGESLSMHSTNCQVIRAYSLDDLVLVIAALL